MIYVLYHSNCMDGVGAKYAAWKKFGNDATYKAVQYGSEFPLLDLTFNDTVYILDFSYPREILVGLSIYTNIVVIDHHDTAMQDLQGLNFAIFDMDKSGAVLAWNYFHPNEPVPQFLLLLQDYDLWNWELKDTLNLTNMFHSDIQREDMDYLDKLVKSCEVFYTKGLPSTDEVNNQLLSNSSIKSANTPDQSDCDEPFTFAFYLLSGKHAGSAMEKEIDGIKSRKKYIIKQINGFNVAIFNTTCFFSMMGHTACEEQNVDYSMSYFFNNDFSLICSFRAKKNTIDVGAIARSLGGGGHKTASGVKIPYPNSLDFIKTLNDYPTVEVIKNE